MFLLVERENLPGPGSLLLSCDERNPPPASGRSAGGRSLLKAVKEAKPRTALRTLLLLPQQCGKFNSVLRCKLPDFRQGAKAGDALPHGHSTCSGQATEARGLRKWRSRAEPQGKARREGGDPLFVRAGIESFASAP